MADQLAKFMATGAGRGVRIVAGLALIALGLFSIGGVGGVVVAAIGLVPLLAGVFNLCIIAALLGGPLKGSDVLQS